jgi:chitodextrinase
MMAMTQPPQIRFAALLLGAAIALVQPDVARARLGPRFVQKAVVEAASGGGVSTAVRRPNASGNLIVVYVVWDGGGAASVSDSNGNPYVSAVGPTHVGGDLTQAQLFFAPNIVGGANIVNAAFTAPLASRGALYVLEYSGLDRSGPLDTAVATSGSSADIDSGPLSTATNGELLIAVAASNAKVTRKPPHYHARSRKYANLVAEQLAAGAGVYDVTATQKGSAWAMQLVAFKAAGSTPPTTAYPLKVSADGRYLVDQHDVPFLISGDSPQALIVNLSEAGADSYFADRQAAGFNAVWINLLCDAYTGGRTDGSTYDGIIPFTTPGDLSTPNPSYFARADAMLQRAAQHGLVVFLDPAETGGWLDVLSANGTTAARAYGRYLGSRYRGFDNIVWMSGNDFQNWPVAGDDAVVQAVADGIEDTDLRHIHTIELNYLVSGSLDDTNWANIIQLNASYTYYPTYAEVLKDYERPNALPTFLVEANYEFEHNAADEGTPQILRRQEYWSLLSGAAGQFYGNHYTWPFASGWQQELDTTGSQQMGYVGSLFAALPWYALIPDQDHSLVTAGYGTFTDRGALADSNYLTAARTPDGALAMVYMPTQRTITVDMSALGAPATAQWYDPSNGTFSAIAGSPFANQGTRNFTPPGTNHDGDGDWVLVVQATGVPADMQAPSVPSGLTASGVTPSQLTLSWSAAADNVRVAGYQIFRDGALIRTTPSTTYTDTGLSPSTAYSYAVAACDYASNVSAPSTPLMVSTSAPGPTFVQEQYATPQVSQSAVSATYPGPQTAGNTNLVAIGWNDTTASITAVTDTAGNTYQSASGTVRGNGLSQAIYVASNIAAASGNQLTVQFDQPATYVDLRVAEYSGLRQPDPFVAAVWANGSGGPATTPTLMVSAPSQLLFAAGMTGGVFSAPGAGYTSRAITVPDGDLVEDLVAASAGSYSASAAVSGTWLLQLAAFAPAD